jgi:hypothetical protein
MSRPPFIDRVSHEKLDELKQEICRFLIYEMKAQRWSDQQIANRLCTSRSNISRINNFRVKQLTFNQLFRYAAILNPGLKILISSR